MWAEGVGVRGECLGNPNCDGDRTGEGEGIIQAWSWVAACETVVRFAR